MYNFCLQNLNLLKPNVKKGIGMLRFLFVFCVITLLGNRGWGQNLLTTSYASSSGWYTTATNCKLDTAAGSASSGSTTYSSGTTPKGQNVGTRNGTTGMTNDGTAPTASGNNTAGKYFEFKLSPVSSAFSLSVTSISLSAFTNGAATATGGAVLYSTNGGTTWTSTDAKSITTSFTTTGAGVAMTAITGTTGAVTTFSTSITASIAFGSSIQIRFIPFRNATSTTSTVMCISAVTVGGTVNSTASAPTISTTAASAITSSGASTGGNVTADGGATVTRRGLIYSTGAITDSNSTTGGGKIIDGSTGTGTFTTTLSSLTQATTYHIRAFAVNSAGVSYGSDLTFTTLANPPTVSTTAASGITTSGASTGGNVSASGGATVTRRGLVYSTGAITDTTSTTGGGLIIDGATGTGTFSTTLSGLSTNTLYHIRAFALNSSGITYGSDLTFTTLAGTPPTLTSPTVSSITANGATLGANITSDGGASITARGTVYKTSSGVTITDNALAEGGTATGVFSHARTGLSPQTQYFFAGYATNSTSTSGLSSESSFYTLSNAPTAAASGLTASAVAGEQINLSWSAATFPGSGATTTGYVILRATAPNTPALTNVNGQAPTGDANTTIVNASALGSATSQSVTGLTGNTQYNFVVIAYTWDGSHAATYNYYTATIPSATATTLASTPTAQPSGLSYASTTCNSFTVNWTAASPAADGVIVLQTNGATAPNTAPSSGTSYTVGGTLGNATIAYIGSATSLSLNGLTDNTAYNFKLYSYNGTGSNTSYLTTSPLSGSNTTSSVAAPTTNGGSGSFSNAFTASWTAPAACANSYQLDVSTNPLFTSTGTIASEGFENSMSLFTAVGGAYFTGTGGSPATNRYSGGTASYGVNNTSAVLTSSTINTSAGGASLTFRLGAFGNTTASGLDANDSVRVEVSPDGGTTWYEQLRVYGNNQASWGVVGTGVGALTASGTYHANNTFTSFAPGSATGLHASDGYSTVTVTGLPAVSNLKVRISMANNVGTEWWIIDDFSVSGNINNMLSGYNSLAVSGTSQSVTGLTASTKYYFRVRAVGSNSTSANSTVDSFTTVALSAPTVTTPTVSSITANGAVLGATVTTSGSLPSITARGTVYKTSTGVSATDNALAEGGTSLTAYTHSRTGLAAQTRYYFKGYASNSGATGLSSEASFITLSNPPTAQASSLAATPQSSAQIDLTWSAATFPGSGATFTKYLLLVASGSNTPVFTGANGAAPTVDANTTIYSSNISGTATTISVLGLSSATTYNFLLIPYTSNGTNDSTYNYLTASAPTVSATTTSAIPPTIVSPTVSSITENSAVLGANITSDGGLTITDRGTVYKTSSPVLASDNYLSEGGTSTGTFSHSRTGLSPQTQYFFAGYAANTGAAGLSSEGSFYTLSNPATAPATSFSSTAVSGSQINLSWSAASFPGSGATVQGYIILSAVAPNTPALTSTNGQAPAVDVNTTIVSSTIAASATTASSTGLSGATQYNYVIIPFTWDGTNAATYNYYTSGAPTTSATTYASTPTAQPTNLVTSSLTCNGLTAKWNNASSIPTGYLVLKTVGATAPNTVPSIGTTYTAGGTLGNATIAYVGTDTSLVLTGLSDNTAYNFKIYSYNGTGSQISYLTTSPLSGTFTTSSVADPTATSATSIYSNAFTANWTAPAACANSYLLDVSTSPTLFSTSASLASENFENALTLFTATGTGAFFSGNATTPATARTTNGTFSYGVNNGTATITSSNINTSQSSGNQLTFRLGAFGTSTTAALDATDVVTVEVSPDGGTTYYSTIQVTGNSNAYWGFTGTGAGTATASTPYDGNTSPVVFAPAAGGSRTTDGYSTVTVTGLPSVSNLKIRITMLNNAASEFWIIDGLTVTGSTLLSGYNGLAVSGTSQAVTGLTAATTYYYRVRSVATNSTSAGSNVITVTTSALSAPTVTTPTVSSITENGAVLGATVTSAGSLPSISARGTVYKTSSGVTATDNAAAEGGTTISSFTQSRTGLAAQTRYYFAGYASNSGPATGLSSEASFITLSNPPTAQASGLGATPISATQIDLNWTAATFPGSGATVTKYLLLAASGSNTPVFTGTNGAAPSVDANTTIISSNVAGSSTLFNVTGLTIATTYNFLLIPYTYNGSNDSTYNYLTAGAQTVTASTTSSLPPSLSAPTVSSITESSAVLGATIDSDGGDAITDRGTVYKTSSPVISTDNYASEGGTSTGTFTQSRTGLSPETHYFFAGYAANSGASALSTESSFYTLSNPPTAEATAFSATAVSGSQINLSWTAASFPSSGATVKGYVLLRALYPNVPALTNTNGQAPVGDVNTTIVSATISSAATTASSSGLSGNTQYNYVIIPFAWDGTNTATYNYYTTNAPAANATTYATLPTAQPTSLTFSGLTCNGFTANWTAATGTPDGYIVLQTSGVTAPNTAPVIGTSYTVGSTVGNATVAYVGNASSVALSSLTDNTVYNFKIYSYNGSGSSINYLTTSPLSGSQTTSSVVDPTFNAASAITSTSFTANWNAASCAASYILTVSNTTTATGTVAQWTFPTSGTTLTADNPGSNSNNIGKLISINPSSTLTSGSTAVGTFAPVAASGWSTVGKYWMVEVNTTGNANLKVSSVQRSSASGPRDFRLEYRIGTGGTWTAVTGGTITVDTAYTLGVLNNLSLPSACDNQSQIFLRWITTSVAANATNTGAVSTSGSNRIDNIFITGTTSTTTFVTGFHNLSVSGTSQNVTGLTPNTTYVVSVQTVGGNSTSAGTSTSTVTTGCDLAISPSSNAPICAGSALNLTSGTTGAFGTATYSWTGPNSFSSTSANPSISSATTAASGTYTLHVTDAAGCSVTSTTSVLVNANSASSTSATACNSYLWNGTTYTSSGTYVYHTTNAVGCDSAASLVLTINTNTSSSTTISACESYVWNGTTYTSSGTYVYFTTNANGCDSTATLVLTINHNSSSSASVTACDSYVWNGTTYTTGGTYTYNTTNASGCDSTATLVLTVNNSSSSSTSVTACDSYTWNGTTYTSSGTYVYHTTNAVGCDSAASLLLTINYTSSSSTSQTACDSYVWNGTTYTASGSYTFTTTNASGCDSTATLLLSINYSSSSSTSITACNNYSWNGTTYTTSGTYSYATINAAGCDSTATLLLTINQSNTSSASVTACDSYVWNGTTYTTSGVYSFNTTNASGCDSTATLILTVNNSSSSSTSQTVCDSYVWNGTTYTTSGSYTYTTTNASGCDSTATLVLTINNASSSSTTISACDSYTWNGSTYSASGTYTYLTTNAAGCDSTATLVLTISNSTTSSSTVTACNSYTWTSGNGTTYTTSGNYTYTTSNGSCTNVATLHLTINHTTSSTTNTTICANQLPYTWNGLTFSAAGSQTATLTNAAGCDSLATLNLTVNTFSLDTIVGPKNVCTYVLPVTGGNATYSVAAVNAATYTWSVPTGATGATIVSGQGTNTIVVHFAATYTGTVATNNKIRVTVTSACGSPLKDSMVVTKATPAAPAAISGPANPCPYVGTGTPVTYSIAPVGGVAVTYRWTLPANVSLVSASSDSTSITVLFNSAFATNASTQKSIKVKSVSGCGNSIDKTLALTTTAPATPGTIAGPTNACVYIGTSNAGTYTIKKIANAGSYIWTVPAGATIASHPGGAGTANDTIITVTYDNSFVDGTPISVQASSGCGTSAAKTLLVRRNLPTLPAAILTNVSDICSYVTSANNPTGTPVAYYIHPVAAAQSYVWGAPAGATLTHQNADGVTDTLVYVTFPLGYTSGNVTLAISNGCGTTTNRTKSVSIAVPALPGTISGPVDACPFAFGGTDATYSIKRVATATEYHWSVSDAVNAHIISHPNGSGANDTVITVHFDGTYSGGNIIVRAARDCGESAAKTLAVAKAVPAKPTISGPTTACPGSTQTFTASAPTGTTYTWTVPAAMGTFTGQGTNQIQITFKSTFNGGSISAKTSSVCGTSAASVNFAIAKVSCTSGSNPIARVNAANLLDVSIYPNPSNGDFNISINTGNQISADAVVDIVNGMGQSVYHNAVKNSVGVVNMHVVNKLASGIYMVNCLINGEKVTKKLVINR